MPKGRTLLFKFKSGGKCFILFSIRPWCTIVQNEGGRRQKSDYRYRLSYLRYLRPWPTLIKCYVLLIATLLVGLWIFLHLNEQALDPVISSCLIMFSSWEDCSRLLQTPLFITQKHRILPYLSLRWYEHNPTLQAETLRPKTSNLFISF